MTASNDRIQTLALLLADARRETNNLTELLEQAARQHMCNLQEIAKVRMEHNEAQLLLATVGDVLVEMQVASREWQTKRTQAIAAINILLDGGAHEGE